MKVTKENLLGFLLAVLVFATAIMAPKIMEHVSAEAPVEERALSVMTIHGGEYKPERAMSLVEAVALLEAECISKTNMFCVNVLDEVEYEEIILELQMGNLTSVSLGFPLKKPLFQYHIKKTIPSTDST